MLYKLFNSLLWSIRVLRLNRSMSTFTNIRRKVDILANRRFDYGHLAQLKFILPEAIELETILVPDVRTCCMSQELHVSLNPDIVQNDEMMHPASVDFLLSNLFRARLVKFCESHPEGDDVPEEILPEPFNPSIELKPLTAIKKPNLGSVQDITHGSYEQQVAVSSLLTPVKLSGNLPETPIKPKDMSSVDGTPAKPISTPYSATPEQAARSPVRGFMTPDDESMMCPSKPSPRKLTRCSSGRKSLTFDSPVKNKTTVRMVSEDDDDDDDDDDLCDSLSDDPFASIEEEEQKALEENDPSISQAKRRKKMIAALPKLVDIVWFFFRSINRSGVTKGELFFNIILNHVDIISRREVDEQLRLLQELAPEWISEKMDISVLTNHQGGSQYSKDYQKLTKRDCATML